MRLNEYFSISCSLVPFKIISLMLPFSKFIKLICQLTSHICNQLLFDKKITRFLLQQNISMTATVYTIENTLS